MEGDVGDHTDRDFGSMGYFKVDGLWNLCHVCC